MIGVLLTPSLKSLRNQFRYSDSSDRTKYYIFIGGTGLFWAALFLFFWYVLGIFAQVEIFGPYLVKKLLSILLLALFSLLCFSNLISALSAFYLSDDLHLLHSLPISLRQMHLGRFINTFLASSWMMVIFGLPIFLAYGVVHHAGPVYYFALLLFLCPFLAIPTAVGVSLATILVNIFPARRTRELMILISAIFVVGLFLLLRIIQPERLVRAESFNDILAFLGQLQTPTATFMPSHWGTEILMPLLTGDVGEPVYYLALTWLTGVASMVISQWLCLALYPAGWTKAQQSNASAERPRGIVDRALRLLVAPLPRPMGELITKDIKMFFRDSAEWPQLLMILALVAIYLYSVSVLPLEGPFITLRIHNIISFMNLAMVGFVVSSIAVRFLFTSVSREGRSFWLLRAGPLNPMQFLMAKYILGLPMLLCLGLILVVLSNILLGVRDMLMGLGVVTMVALSFSMAGLSVGIGAMYPNFKAENVAKIAAGPGGILFMILAQLFVGAVLVLEAIPVYLIVRADYRHRSLASWEWALVASLVALALLLNVAAAVIPMRKGARALEALD